MKYTQQIRKAADDLDKACYDLDKICFQIENSRPKDDPQEYKTVAEFETAWNLHYSYIEEHQRKMHEYDDAVTAMEEAMMNVEAPMFNLY